MCSRHGIDYGAQLDLRYIGLSGAEVVCTLNIYEVDYEGVRDRSLSFVKGSRKGSYACRK